MTPPDIQSARRSKLNTNPGFFVAAIVMYALITAVVAIQWRTVADVVGPHGGDGQYLCNSAAATSIPIFLETVLALNFAIADGIMVRSVQYFERLGLISLGLSNVYRLWKDHEDHYSPNPSHRCCSK